MTLDFPLLVQEPGRAAVPGTFRLPRAARVDGPLISCLMVSRGRRLPAAFAIDCYRRQSYRNRELVIVTAQADSPLARLIGEIGDPSIHYHELPPQTLGELRNASVARANGALLCHWDDDDLQHGDRLSVQAAALGETQAQACFLQRILLWWPARRLLRISQHRLWEASILIRREAMPHYPAWPREEDLRVTELVARRHRLAAIDMPIGYCYAIHGANTNAPAHFEEMFRLSAPIPDAADYDAQLAVAAEAYPVADYRRAMPFRR